MLQDLRHPKPLTEVAEFIAVCPRPLAITSVFISCHSVLMLRFRIYLKTNSCCYI